MSSGNFFDRIGHGFRRELPHLSGAGWSNEINHRLQQWGVPQAWASNIGTALAPTVMPHHMTSYYAARDRGMDTTDARQFATSDAIRTAAAAAAVYGGVEAAGAYGAGGAGGSGATSGFGGFAPATGGESSTLFGGLYGGGSAPASFGGIGTTGGLNIGAGSAAGSGIGGGLFGGGYSAAANAPLAGQTAGSGIDYQSLLKNMMQQGQSSGGGGGYQGGNSMQPITSAPAQAGMLNASAPQQAQAPQQDTINPMLLAMLLNKRY